MTPARPQVHRVEVVGGATRIPRVKEAAKEFFGRETLDGSLNGDEAAAANECAASFHGCCACPWMCCVVRVRHDCA